MNASGHESGVQDGYDLAHQVDKNYKAIIMLHMKIGVSDLFERGMDQSEEIIGLHGTAWESVLTLHRTGFLPATLNNDIHRKGIAASDHRDDCVYFFPVRKHFTDHKNAAYFPETIQEGVDAARIGYANRIGRELALITSFDLDIHSSKVRDLADRVTGQPPGRFESMKEFFQECKSAELYDLLKRKGHSDQDVKRVLVEATQREGIVLAIRKTIVGIFDLHEDVTDREALAVVCPQGLPIEHICGIEPCGDYEYEQLEKLSN